MKFSWSTLNTVLVFVVYSLNFLLLVGALVTIYVCVSEQRQKDLIDNVNINFEFLVFFTKTLIVVAVVIAMVCFIGCVGIAIDNDYMLIGYIILIGVLMTSQIFLSTYLSHKLVSSEDDLRRKILSYITKHSKEDEQKMNGFQSKYSCCGIEDYKDWLKEKGGPGHIPGSCCKKKFEEICTVDLVEHTKGCKKAIMDEISSVLNKSVIVIFIIFGLEVLLAICTILVILDIGQTDEDNTSDENVVVASLKKKLPGKKGDANFEESIDTHDLHQNHPESIQSPIAKEEEIEGLYDEEKNIQKAQEDEIHDDELHEEEINETSEKLNVKDNEDIHHEEEIPKEDLSKEEILNEEKLEIRSQEEGVDGKKNSEDNQQNEGKIRKTTDEDIYLEGNLEKDSRQELPSSGKITDKKQKETKIYLKKRSAKIKKKNESAPGLKKPIQKRKDEKDEEEEEQEEEEEDEEEEENVSDVQNQTKLEENIHVSKSKHFDKEEKIQKERIRNKRKIN